MCTPKFVSVDYRAMYIQSEHGFPNSAASRLRFRESVPPVISLALLPLPGTTTAPVISLALPRLRLRQRPPGLMHPTK